MMHIAKVTVVRWQSPTPPQEQDLRNRMLVDGLSPYTWSNGPGDRYAVHSHAYEKVLYCVQGSIRFLLPDQPDSLDAVELGPGDCLYLPSTIRHSAIVGSHGVICLEAARHA